MNRLRARGAGVYRPAYAAGTALVSVIVLAVVGLGPASSGVDPVVAALAPPPIAVATTPTTRFVIPPDPTDEELARRIQQMSAGSAPTHSQGSAGSPTTKSSSAARASGASGTKAAALRSSAPVPAPGPAVAAPLPLHEEPQPPVPPGVPPVTGEPTSGPLGSASSYKLLHVGTNGQPSRWNPCAPIKYALNLTRAPEGAQADVVEALDRVSQATGMSFEFVGTTNLMPQPDWGTRQQPQWPGQWAPLLIAWANTSDTSVLRGNWGYGQGFYVDSGVERQYISGQVTIDANLTANLAGGFGSGPTRGELLMHELGHAVGLDHTDDASQIMFRYITTKWAQWGAGDLTGLRLLGREAGCMTNFQPPWA